MPEKIHCSICGQPFHAKNFADGMAKLRRHRKKNHPAAFRASVKKGMKTRKSKK